MGLIFSVVVTLQIHPAPDVTQELIKYTLETFTWKSAVISRILGSDSVIVASEINSVIGVANKILYII